VSLEKGRHTVIVRPLPPDVDPVPAAAVPAAVVAAEPAGATTEDLVEDFVAAGAEATAAAEVPGAAATLLVAAAEGRPRLPAPL
jgi:hypothetical protein